jgi:hypothetical protein
MHYMDTRKFTIHCIRYTVDLKEYLGSYSVRRFLFCFSPSLVCTHANSHFDPSQLPPLWTPISSTQIQQPNTVPQPESSEFSPHPYSTPILISIIGPRGCTIYFQFTAINSLYMFRAGLLPIIRRFC